MLMEWKKDIPYLLVGKLLFLIGDFPENLLLGHEKQVYSHMTVCNVSTEFFFRKFRLLYNQAVMLLFPTEVPEKSPMWKLRCFTNPYLCKD